MAWPPVSLNADKELARYVIDEAAQTLPLDLDRQAALRSRDGLIALARALYEALARSDIRYALERFEADARVQHVRPPEAILGGAGEGTCLDLVLLYAGLALGKDLLPLVVVLEGHALVAVSLAYTRYTASDMGRGQEGGWVDSGLLSDDGSTLRDLIDKGQYLAIECTGFAASSALPADVPEGAGRIDGRLGFEAAVAAGRAQLALARRPFRFAIDVAVLRDHHGVFAYEAPLAGVTTPYRHRLDRLMAQARETLFGGRGDELAWLDGAVAAGTSGHVFVSGESGSGKTALLANWVRRLLERPVAKPGEMALRLAYVFINRDAELADQPAVLHLLCHQLLRAHGRVENVPSDLASIEQRCVELLASEPPAGRRIVAVIDGLDEAEAQGWSPKFLLPRKAPARVHIVFSARNIAERNWIEWLGLSEPDVRARELHALALPAVAALLRQAPALSAKADDATFVAELFAVSDGDPMYLRLLIEDLAKAATQGMPTVHDVSIKPKGLDNYLKAWWNDLAAQQKAGPAVRDLLGYLLVARGALPRDVLIDVDEHDHLDSVSVDDAIARIRRYVVGDEQAGFRFGHPRLRRYLIGDRLRPSDLRGVAVALARWCEGAWPGADNRYAAQFVIGQLREQRDRCAPAERPAITGRMLALLRNDEFRRRRNDDPEGLLHDESDFADVLGAALADPLPEQLPSLAEAVLATAGLQHTLGERVLRIFDRARGGAPDSAAKMLPPLAPDARWLAAMLLVCCGLAALAGREGAAKFRRACSDAIRPEAFDATLQLLDQRVDALLRAEPPRPESWPLPYPPGLLPVESVNGDIARAIVTRMGGGGDAELLAAHLDPSMIASINRGLSPDGLPVYLAERDSPWLVAQAMRAAAGHDGMTRDEAEELIRRYIAAHATNPYREYRHRSLWAVLGAVLAHPDPGTALDGARAVCEAAAQPVSVDFREMLRLAGLGLAARLGDSAAAGMLAQCVVGARDAAKELRQVRGGADTWGAHARRFAALAEVHGVALGDALGAAGLLADAHGLPFGYAGFQASASLAVADAEFVCRPADAASLHDALDAARRAAHNVQEARFCALTTARVHTICTRWRPGSVADLADVVERFAREPLAAEFAPRHVAGEDYGERDDGPHMLSLPDAVRQARTLEAIARDVFALPWDRVARLNAGAGPRDRLAEVAVPDPGFVPLLASRLASELLARRAVLGASAAVLMARLVPAAAGDATALDAVMARLALAYAPADAALVQRLISVAPTDWMRSPIPNRNVEA